MRPSIVSTAATYGVGCGNPLLDLAATAPPIIGQTGQVVVSNVPSPFAFVSAGWSNTVKGSLALPLLLTGIGMPGCYLLHSAELVGLPVAPSGSGTANFDWPVPNVGGLMWQRFYLQAWAFAPGQNAVGLTTSNGVEWLIGNS